MRWAVLLLGEVNAADLPLFQRSLMLERPPKVRGMYLVLSLLLLFSEGDYRQVFCMSAFEMT